MRFSALLILLLFPIWLNAQPGPFGGFTTGFRVYSPKGDMILCGDKSYKIFPSYTKTYNYKNLKVVDSFHCNNSRFEFAFKSTPMGAAIPRNFIINIVHNYDTMQVSAGLHMDSIPFRKGKYTFNTHSFPLYEIKRKNRAKVNNLNWELMEDGQQIEQPQVSFLYEAGLNPNNYSGEINVVESPDDKGLIAFARNSDEELIWNFTNNSIWAKPYGMPIKKLYQLSATPPASFTVSNLNFIPNINKVTKASWAGEPLLPFYLFSQMHFADSLIAYMLLEGVIYKTTDAGNNWKQVSVGDKKVSKIYSNKNDMYAVFSTNEYTKIKADDSILHIRSFKTGTYKAEIYSIQFQNDSVAYFLINSGNGGGEMLFKATNGKISRKPSLRFLPYTTKLIVTDKSIILWFGEKSFWKSNDGGAKWNFYDNKSEYANDERYFDKPDYYIIINVFADKNGILKAFIGQKDGSVLYGEIVLGEQVDSNKKSSADNRIKVIKGRMKEAKDSTAFCNCLNYGKGIKNSKQIENGTYYRTQLKFLLDRVPSITLQDGKFWYNSQNLNKEINSIPSARGTYVANENTINFKAEDERNYLNGIFYYFFDGQNFQIYHCDKSKGFNNKLDFYNFDRDSIYHAPMPMDTAISAFRDHASAHVYSFTPDSEKIVITLVDTLGKGIENASIKLDDIYAKPMSTGNLYYFDKRTLSEFQPGNVLLLLISHPDFDPLVTELSANSVRYVLKRKKNK